MTKPDDPAFVIDNNCEIRGLTIREYFAIKIMAGFAADPNFDSVAQSAAETAVYWADCLIAELNKETQP